METKESNNIGTLQLGPRLFLLLVVLLIELIRRKHDAYSLRMPRTIRSAARLIRKVIRKRKIPIVNSAR